MEHETLACLQNRPRLFHRVPFSPDRPSPPAGRRLVPSLSNSLNPASFFPSFDYQVAQRVTSALLAGLVATSMVLPATAADLGFDLNELQALKQVGITEATHKLSVLLGYLYPSCT
jgi:hypothetical protein